MAWEGLAQRNRAQGIFKHTPEANGTAGVRQDPSKLLAVFSAVVSLGTLVSWLANVLGGRDKLEDVVSAVSPIAAAILPHIAIGFALAAGLWLVWLGVGFWGRLWEKTGYWLSDGATVDRFRALAPEIGAYKARMICHYEAHRSAAPRHLEDASEDSLLIMQMATLFGDLQYLGIPRPDRQRFTDQNRTM